LTGGASALWERARKALLVAQETLPLDADTSASRAYYAAFYAVTAHFAAQGKGFSRHTAVEAAVHRDLVHPGIWPAELGRAFSRLAQLRHRADYGGAIRVGADAAREAAAIAGKIVQAVHLAHPDAFPLD